MGEEGMEYKVKNSLFGVSLDVNGYVSPMSTGGVFHNGPWDLAAFRGTSECSQSVP